MDPRVNDRIRMKAGTTDGPAVAKAMAGRLQIYADDSVWWINPIPAKHIAPGLRDEEVKIGRLHRLRRFRLGVGRAF